MRLKRLISSIFFNQEQPAISWLILTAGAVLFGPLLLWYPVGIISLFFHSEPAAVVFFIAVIGGMMLFPTILYVGVKARFSLVKLSSYWVLFLTILTIPSSIAYEQYIKAEREEMLRQHISTECENAEVVRFEHFLGDNFDNEPYSTISFTCNKTAYDFRLNFRECNDILCGFGQILVIPADTLEDTFDLLKYMF